MTGARGGAEGGGVFAHHAVEGDVDDRHAGDDDEGDDQHGEAVGRRHDDEVERSLARRRMLVADRVRHEGARNHHPLSKMARVL